MGNKLRIINVPRKCVTDQVGEKVGLATNCSTANRGLEAWHLTIILYQKKSLTKSPPSCPIFKTGTGVGK